MGCSVLSRAIQLGTSENVQLLVQPTLHHLDKLVFDPFGNFFVQALLDKLPSTAAVVSRWLIPRAVIAATHKFGSNVVEKCLGVALEEDRQALVSALLNNQDDFLELVDDPFGNFVVQACLDAQPPNERKALATRILSLLPTNGRFVYHITKKARAACDEK